jgi:hypothetical protein
MTPQEKAEELFKKFMFYTLNDLSNENFEQTRQCALVAVQEIIEKLVELSDGKFTYINDVQYYQEVKQEIEKL